MIVPPNVRTQRRLFLPDRERGGEGKQDARILLHLFYHRRRGKICSQLRLICLVLKASSSHGLTPPLDERGEKEKGRDAKRRLVYQA